MIEALGEDENAILEEAKGVPQVSGASMSPLFKTPDKIDFTPIQDVSPGGERPARD